MTGRPPNTLVLTPEIDTVWTEFERAVTVEERTQALRELYKAVDGNDALHMRIVSLVRAALQHGQATAIKQELHIMNDNRIKNTTTVHAQQAQVAVATHGSTATVTHASQHLAPGEFSVEVLRAEVAQLFTLVAERIEALEAKDQPAAMEAVTALKAVKFDGVTSEADARQMLEDLWADKMKTRYSALGKIAEALGEHAGPLVVKFITRLVTGLG